MPKLNRAVEIRPTLTTEKIEKYLEKEGNVRWIEAEQLLSSESAACIDGRATDPVVGNPGGDMAILMEVAIAIGNQRQEPLEQIEFQAMLEWYLEEFGSFYFHTDEHGIEHVREGLNKDKYLVKALGGTFDSIESVKQFITSPPAELQIRLLGHLLHPKNIGCGHFKQMLTNPTAYGASRKVIAGLMSAFFELKWNGSTNQKEKLTYHILTGDHAEKAVVVVNFPDGVSDKTPVPMIRPTDGKVSVFVVHPQVTHYMQEQAAHRLVKSNVLTKMNAGMIKNMLTQMKNMHLKETQTTASRLAWGLPLVPFEVR